MATITLAAINGLSLTDAQPVQWSTRTGLLGLRGTASAAGTLALLAADDRLLAELPITAGAWQWPLSLSALGVWDPSQQPSQTLNLRLRWRDATGVDTLLPLQVAAQASSPPLLPVAIDPDGASGPLGSFTLLRGIQLGDGPPTASGSRLLVDYSGWLENGSLFDSSLSSGRLPLDLTLGQGRLISAWDLGLQGIPVGSLVELLVPPELGYGAAGSGASIPGGATLRFTVDLRADLSLPEAFLRDLVWPDLFGADLAQTNAALRSATGLDLLGVALKYGPGDGTTGPDILTLAPPSGFPADYPLLAMGGAGADQITTFTQPMLAFGESGNDLLRAGAAPYVFLDGGSGDDRFQSAALITWIRGGGGVDTAVLPAGDWRQLQTGTLGGESWRELGRFDASGALQQLLDLQGVETLQRDRWSALASSSATDEFAALQALAAGGSLAGGVRNAQALVQRRGAAGELIWERELGGGGQEQILALQDLGSSVLVAGASTSAATDAFAPASPAPNLQPLAAGETRGYLAWLDSTTGALQQQYLLDGPGAASFSTALRLSDGSLLLAGTASDLETDRAANQPPRLRLLDTSGAVLASLDLSQQASADPIWLKLKPDRSLAWLRSTAQASTQRLEDLVQAADGDIWALGESNPVSSSGAEPRDLMLWRLDASTGSLKATQRLGSAVVDTARDLQVVGDQLWITGAAAGPLDRWFTSGADPTVTTAVNLASLSRSGTAAGGDDAILARITASTGQPLSWQVLPSTALYEQGIAVVPWASAGGGASADSVLLLLNRESSGAMLNLGGGYDPQLLQLDLSGTLQRSQSLSTLASDLLLTAALDGAQLLLAGRAMGAVDGVSTSAVDGVLRSMVPFTTPVGTPAATALMLLDRQLAASTLQSLDQANTVPVDATAVEVVLGSIDELTAVLTAPGLVGLGQASLQLSNTTAAASAMIALMAAGSQPIQASSLTALSGSVAELQSVYAAAAAGRISGLGNESLVVSGAISALDQAQLDGLSSGVITATISDGSMSELAKLSDVNGNNALTITVSDGTAGAAALKALDGKTSVVVNASAVNSVSGSASELKDVLGASGLSLRTTLQVVVSGTSAAAADLLVVDGRSTGVVNASAVSSVSGTASELKALYAAATAGGISGLGNEGLMVSGAISALDQAQLDGLSSGVITATISDGSMSELAKLSDVNGNNALTITVSDGTAGAAALKALDGKTSVVVNASAVSSVSGTASELKALYAAATAGGISGLGNEGLMVSGAISALDQAQLDGLSSGVITATISDGSMSELAKLSDVNGNNALTITVSDGTASAAALKALDGKTSVVVNASAVSSVSGTASELKALYAAATAGGISGLGNEGLVVSGAISALDQAQLDGLSSGVITATISDGSMSELAKLSDVNGNNALTITVSDVTAGAAALKALDGKTSVVVNASAVSSVSGTASELKALYAAATAGGISGLGNEGLVVSGAISALDQAQLDGLSSGVITATISDGSMAELAKLSDVNGNNALTITVSDVTAGAAALKALDGKTSVVVNASAVSSVSGSASELKALYAAATAGGISGLGNEGLMVSGAISALDQAQLDGLSSGVITATISDGSMSELAKLSDVNGNNALTITVSDGTASAAALKALDGKTSVVVNASAVSSVSGSASELKDVLGASGLSLRTTLQVVVSGMSAAAADLLVVDGRSTGVVNASAVNSVSGSASELKALYAAATAGGISGLGNESLLLTGTSVSAAELLDLDALTTATVQAAELQLMTGSSAERNQVFNASGLSINLRDDVSPAASGLLLKPSDGVYRGGETISFELGFDEPLRVQGLPCLLLSDGLKANYDSTRSNLDAGRVAFTYVPQSGDQSSDLRLASNGLSLPNGARIDDRAGNSIALAIPAFDAAVSVDARPPELKQINATPGVYGPNRTIRFSVEFSEPVRWQATQASTVPVLQLSNGLSASWVPPTSAGALVSTQQFDLFTGTQPPDVTQLQVLGMLGVGQFFDSAGNGVLSGQLTGLSLKDSVSLRSQVAWNLDVDGDGKVSALGDGLMIIRKLFGASFSGDALTAKARSATATRSTTEIHAYIQSGIDQGLLDIDRDGQTRALGDGLMLIRQLFGSSFAGDALISKAISADSRLIPSGQTLSGLDAESRRNLADQVRSEINALMPPAIP